MDSEAELNRELVNQHWIWKNSLTVQMAITFIQWNLVQSTLSFTSLGFVRSVRCHWMQNSLLHAVWTEMCLGSVCPQPPYNDKNTPLFRHRSRQECILSDWGVLLLDVVMNIAVVIYSRHLSCWRCTQVDYFCFGREWAPHLPKCIYGRANHLWSSFTDRSIRFFNESLWIAFPNNVLVSKFRS